MITGVESRRRDRWARTDASRFPNRSISYLNNRHYDPTVGVFISVDPLVTTTGEAYIYGDANPVTYSDPSGLCSHFTMSSDGRYTCDFYNPGGSTRIWGDRDGGVEGCRSARASGCGSPPPQPVSSTDSCRAAPQVCGPEPATSGLGIGRELELIDELGRLPVDEFYDLALDPDEIERRGLGFLDWSNDGCSNSPDAVGGTSLLGACARHDFSYRNLKAWEQYTGDNIFSMQSRRRADDLLKQGINDVCGWECDWAAPIYWSAVHGYGDGLRNPLPWDGVIPGSIGFCLPGACGAGWIN